MNTFQLTFTVFILLLFVVYLLWRVHGLQRDIDFLVTQNHLQLMEELKEKHMNDNKSEES